MPITEFQRYVLGLLKAHRSPNSYIAGGVAINRAPTSQRLSNDIDFFHDIDEAVVQSATSDMEVLRGARCTVEILINQPSFWRAVVSRGEQALKLEWVRDTAFRFYPVVEDADLGYRLHDVDLAVNKCLALANRNAVRDILDMLQFEEQEISLSSAAWAACGKDPGFTPEMLVACMRKNSIIRPEQLAAESLVSAISPTELKSKWLASLERAEKFLSRLPTADLGCVYLDTKGRLLNPEDPATLKGAVRHFGTVGGAWPRLGS